MDKPRVVVVTGAGSGIGRASAIRFAREGFTVIACGRRVAPLQETAEIAAEEDFIRIGLFELIDAFKQVLEKVPAEHQVNITTDRISV